MRRQCTAEERAELVALVTSGQATLSAAASRVGVSHSTAYYWIQQAAKRQARPSATPPMGQALSDPAPTFVQLVRANEVGAFLELRVGAVEIRVRRGFDAELLRAVVEALREGAA